MHTQTNGATVTAAIPDRAPELEQPSAGQPLARRALEFELANVDEAWRMSAMLSKSQLLPDALRDKPNDVLVILLTGRELGLSPMQSLRLISVVKGKPYLEAKLKIGLVKRSPECVYFKFTETNAERATAETERVGEGKTTLTFTAAEARAAGLLGRATKSGEPDNWAKYTALMLRWRAGSQLCDAVYPDIVGGIGTNDELDEVRRTEQKARVHAPPPPPIAPERVVGSGSTVKATPSDPSAGQPEQKSEEPLTEKADPHDPVTGVVVDEQPAASPAPTGDDPDSFTDRLIAEMSAAVEANNLSALTKLAQKAKEVPSDRQDEVLKHYQQCKTALKEKAQKAGGAA